MNWYVLMALSLAVLTGCGGGGGSSSSNSEATVPNSVFQSVPRAPLSSMETELNLRLSVDTIQQVSDRFIAAYLSGDIEVSGSSGRYALTRKSFSDYLKEYEKVKNDNNDDFQERVNCTQSGSFTRRFFIESDSNGSGVDKSALSSNYIDCSYGNVFSGAKRSGLVTAKVEYDNKTNIGKITTVQDNLSYATSPGKIENIGSVETLINTDGLVVNQIDQRRSIDSSIISTELKTSWSKTGENASLDGRLCFSGLGCVLVSGSVKNIFLSAKDSLLTSDIEIKNGDYKSTIKSVESGILDVVIYYQEGVYTSYRIVL